VHGLFRLIDYSQHPEVSSTGELKEQRTFKIPDGGAKESSADTLKPKEDR